MISGIIWKGNLVSLCLSGILLLSTRIAPAQAVAFELKSSPNADFTFNTIEKYVQGITLPHVLELNVNVTGTEWDLYIGTTTSSAGSWNVATSYSNTGISPPPVGLLQARVYNTNLTPQTGTGFFPLTDIGTPTWLIGSTADDPAVSCADVSPVGTNQPGDYLADPSCYRFKVDLKVSPGLTYRPGYYNLRVDFILIPDL